MPKVVRSLFSGVLLLFCSGVASGEMLTWQRDALPPLPMAISGQMAGTHGNALIVAGGSYFPVSPWQGGKKYWDDRVYLWQPGMGAWEEAGMLPEARAYAPAVSHATGFWIFGGTDGQRVFDDTLRLTVNKGVLHIERIELTLPLPCAFTSAALLGDTVYITGGQRSVDATEALSVFWALDLTQAEAGWRILEAPPGPGRILSVLAAQDGGIYLFSGCSLEPGQEISPWRQYLVDGYRYTPGTGWRTVSGPPHALAAAPAAPLGHAHIIALSGDDGRNFARTAELGDDHPGFSRRALAYHTITDTWTDAGEAPAGLVTTQAVVYGGRIVIPGGEDRPGHRDAVVLSGEPSGRRASLGRLDYATLIIYLLALIVMGFYFSRREKSTEVFFLGGRRLPWWAVGLSLFGTSLSSITYLSIPARAYATDWVYIIGQTGILFLAPLIVHYYLPAFRRAPISTAYEYLEQRFNLAIRIYGSLCFVVFQIGRVGIVLLLPAIALSAATGIDITLCIFLMGGLATLYTALGGIEAVIWTDVLQSIVLVFGAVLALILIVMNIDGGAPALLSTAHAAGKFHTFNWTWDAATTAVWVVLIGNIFANAYPATADQTVVQRYLSTPSVAQAARAVWTNALLTIPISLLFFSLGTALWVYFRQHPEWLDPTLKNDAILPLFVAAKFPIGLRGILIAGVFAAAMSSLDSSINSVSSVLVNDYYRRYLQRFKPREGADRRALRIARCLTLLFGICGTIIAIRAAQIHATSLWDPFLELLNFVGGGLAGIFALGVFTRRANGFGAMAGAAAGAFAVLMIRQSSVHFFLHGMTGFLSAFAVGYLFSLLRPAPKTR